MAFEAVPLLLGKFHAFPIIVARRILGAELDAPGLIRCRLSGGDMSLKFNGVGAGPRHGVDVGVRRTETAIMSLSNLSYNLTAAADLAGSVKRVSKGHRRKFPVGSFELDLYNTCLHFAGKSQGH